MLLLQRKKTATQKEGMSQENYPTQPTERFESKSLVERFYRQPRIGEDQVNSATQCKSETLHLLLLFYQKSQIKRGRSNFNFELVI